jgi:hypothetical protein
MRKGGSIPSNGSEMRFTTWPGACVINATNAAREANIFMLDRRCALRHLALTRRVRQQSPPRSPTFDDGRTHVLRGLPRLPMQRWGAGMSIRLWDNSAERA